MTTTDTTTTDTTTSNTAENNTAENATAESNRAESNTAELGTGRLESLIDTYLASYCEPDPARRAAMIAEAWAPNGELVDPPLTGRGHAELAALTDAVLTNFPGHRFRRTTAVDTHHDRARYGWELVGPDGAVTLAGADFAELAEGRIVRIVGFFGPLTDR